MCPVEQQKFKFSNYNNIHANMQQQRQNWSWMESHYPPAQETGGWEASEWDKYRVLWIDSIQGLVEFKKYSYWKYYKNVMLLQVFDLFAFVSLWMVARRVSCDVNWLPLSRNCQSEYYRGKNMTNQIISDFNGWEEFGKWNKMYFFRKAVFNNNEINNIMVRRGEARNKEMCDEKKLKTEIGCKRPGLGSSTYFSSGTTELYFL